jgi:hypothetical protein
MAETEWGKCKDCKWVQIELDAVEASTSSDDADNSKPRAIASKGRLIIRERR